MSECQEARENDEVALCKHMESPFSCAQKRGTCDRNFIPFEASIHQDSPVVFLLQIDLSYFVEDFHVVLNSWQALVSFVIKPASQRQNKTDTLCSNCSTK